MVLLFDVLLPRHDEGPEAHQGTLLGRSGCYPSGNLRSTLHENPLGVPADEGRFRMTMGSGPGTGVFCKVPYSPVVGGAAGLL